MKEKERLVLVRNLRKARKMMGLTQAEAGAIVGIGGSAYALWEKKEKDKGTQPTIPSYEQLETLADAYDLPVAYWISDGKLSEKDKARFEAKYKHIKNAVSFAKSYYTLIDGFAFDRNYLPEEITQTFTAENNDLAPDINSGDILIIDTAETDIKDGIFAIDFNGITKLKHIKVKINGDFVVSDNTNESEKFTKRKKLPIIGRCVNKISSL